MHIFASMQADTRQRILEKNFEVMHEHGYQGMRADKVVKELGITKGALYHYFESKQALGYAIVDELIGPMYRQLWSQANQPDRPPLQAIETLLRRLMAQQPQEKIRLGCPLNNLMQEMSPLDEGFRVRLQRILTDMQTQIAQALRRAQAQGHLRTGVQPEDVAAFLVAAVEGAFGTAKVLQSPAFLESAMHALIDYVQRLAADT
ncbi:MAG: TetR/AcrR family transcriptional regulator [Bacteroidia bacterium]